MTSESTFSRASSFQSQCYPAIYSADFPPRRSDVVGSRYEGAPSAIPAAPPKQ